jgi:uncharacterized damage-inducible protein DinB
MPTFEEQLKALSASTERICTEAAAINWNGEGWTPAIILGHIVDVDKEVWMARFELMREAKSNGKPIPQLISWEPDPVATAEKYADFSVEQSQKLLNESRSAMITYLTSMPEEDRTAAAHHDAFGDITIESMVQVILDHDEEHRLSLHN